jgi:hypothetical protein
MKHLFEIPHRCLDHVNQVRETGIGYHIVSVELKDRRRFDQVVVSEGCIIQVRGYTDIPFGPQDVAAVRINNERWNFRDCSDGCTKSRAASA